MSPLDILLAEDYFDEIVIYEQRSTIGGVWNYTPEITHDFSQVPQLEANQLIEKPEWRLVKGLGRRSKRAVFCYSNVQGSRNQYPKTGHAVLRPAFPKRNTALSLTRFCH